MVRGNKWTAVTSAAAWGEEGENNLSCDESVGLCSSKALTLKGE